MSQIMHLSKEASYLSARGELTQSWLKKHPAADAQYGAVKGENNAVIKEIILDPLYRSYHTTGLYLPAGELISVKVEGLKPGEKVSLINSFTIHLTICKSILSTTSSRRRWVLIECNSCGF